VDRPEKGPGVGLIKVKIKSLRIEKQRVGIFQDKTEKFVSDTSF
jgi:hypothetical protein